MARTLALPLQRVSGRLVTVEQGSAAEVAQSVALLLATRPGERRSVPTYGLPDQLFGTEVDVDQVAGAIADWEARADEVVIAEAVADLDTRVVSIGLRPGGAV